MVPTSPAGTSRRDPFVRLHRIDENTASEVAPLLAYLRELQRTLGCAVALVHHARKGGHARAGQALRGSSELHAWGGSNLYLRRDSEGPGGGAPPARPPPPRPGRLRRRRGPADPPRDSRSGDRPRPRRPRARSLTLPPRRTPSPGPGSHTGRIARTPEGDLLEAGLVMVNKVERPNLRKRSSLTGAEMWSVTLDISEGSVAD